MDNGEALTRVAQDFLVCIVTVWFIRYSWDGAITARAEYEQTIFGINSFKVE